MNSVNTVFILGAGASKIAGVPLMADFLDTAYRICKLNDVINADRSFSNVFKAQSKLQQVHSKSQLDFVNVESVFSTFEMANTLGKFGDYSKPQIRKLVSSMKMVIVKTIEESMRLPVEMKQVVPPPPYDEFIQLVKILSIQARPKHNVSILTFNYDLALDYAAYHNTIPINYGFDDSSSGMPVLKLHGSINWAQSMNGNRVYPWELSTFFRNHQWSPIFNDTAYKKLKIGSNISDYSEEISEKISSDPMIVPPTWNKTAEYKKIHHVWAQAAVKLSEAENIIVIGYSLPPSDAFFSQLYALGTMGDTILRRFHVYNPDPLVESRFSSLLGPGANQRFRFITEPFNKAIVSKKNELLAG